MIRACPNLDDTLAATRIAASGLLLVAALFVHTPARCVQIVDAADGATLYLKVSKRDITRIALDQGRIAAVRVRAGELAIEPDEDSGQVFVSVPPDHDRPVTAFLTTAAGHTFTLLLQPVDVPADSIIVRSPAHAPRAQSDAVADPFIDAQKKLVVALAADAIPRGAEMREVATPYLLWKDVRMTLQRLLLTDSLIGERYAIANQGSEELVLEERTFYRPGVNAIGIDRLRLPPGASTTLYVVRERNSDD